MSKKANGHPAPVSSEDTTATMTLGAVFAKSREATSHRGIDTEDLDGHTGQVRTLTTLTEIHRGGCTPVSFAQGKDAKTLQEWKDFYFEVAPKGALKTAIRPLLEINKLQREEDSDQKVWRSPWFHFTYFARAHHQLRPYHEHAPTALTMVERAMYSALGCLCGAEWTVAAMRGLPDWEDQPEPEDSRTEFLKLWPTMRYTAGEEPIDAAAIRATKTPLLLRGNVREKRAIVPGRPSGYAAFVSLAGWLQVAMGPKEILLPCKLVGQKMKLSPRTIATYRDWAIEDGYLAVAGKHEFMPKQNRRLATRFRFNVSTFDSLSQLAHESAADRFEFVKELETGAIDK